MFLFSFAFSFVVLVKISKLDKTLRSVHNGRMDLRGCAVFFIDVR